jgi:L-alanine-DL-glutamate epimerase-like enolase superfamily enzyme
MRITDYRVEKLVVPERLVSDSAIDDLVLDEFEYVYLELETDTGERGIGYSVVDMESPASTPIDVWRARFEEIFAELDGASPFQVRNSLSRHRGGMVAYHASESYGTGLRRAVDFALWDLCGKHLNMPVYRLMGGENPKVPVYASGLAFASDDDEVVELYERARDMGIQAAKVKVGYPTVEEDIERIRLVRDVFDGDCTLMVDANEKWSAKQTMRRARACEEAGLDIYWIEDPMFRDDVAGLERVAEQVQSAHLNTGEYCGFEGKRELLEHGAADVLNVHGLSPARKAAHLAYSHAVPIATGTDHAGCVSAVQVGAALPEVTYAEFTMQRFYDIAGQPFDIEDGYAIAPDTPGHGVELSEDTIQEYSVGE